ncbi:hypothetical protein DPMN_080571 [Dreissena polymorpha]|uniref:Uncharacterized protein n=1 Tax=Dreissena polymorpha TaxID=45954 RepID=A0A9D4BS05_DREPO|nr:hypothetical protein DPMN_080571 [Dreissena polymorpha]
MPLSPIKKVMPRKARPVTPKDIFLYHSKKSKNNLGPGKMVVLKCAPPLLPLSNSRVEYTIIVSA